MDNQKNKRSVSRNILTGMLGFLLVASVASVASAERPGYGPAGCGLGSVILGNDTGFGQVFAQTTNGTSASQTFGITSGTSNCDDHGSMASAARRFIENNRDALVKDAARGNGETITALSTIAGCAAPDAVGRTLQAEYDSIVPSAEATDAEVSGQILELLETRTELSCEALS